MHLAAFEINFWRSALRFRKANVSSKFFDTQETKRSRRFENGRLTSITNKGCVQGNSSRYKTGGNSLRECSQRHSHGDIHMLFEIVYHLSECFCSFVDDQRNEAPASDMCLAPIVLNSTINSNKSSARIKELDELQVVI